MKKFNLGARYATFAVVCATGFLAVAPAAQAQVWFEARAWPQSRFYEEVPPVYREEPRFAAPAALPRRAVRQIIESQGFEVIGAMQFTGDAYIVQALDARGRVRRVVVDALDGDIIESALLAAQPRSPGGIGRGRDAYVTSPDIEMSPGLRSPRSNWSDERAGFPTPPPAVNIEERRARERFARQSPEGFDAPWRRMDDVNIAPGFNAAPPAPRMETRKAAPAKQRAVKKLQPKPASRQQAARTPSAAARPQSAKVEAAKPVVPKPEATKTDPVKVEAAIAPANRVEPTRPAAVTPPVAKPEASRSNSVLRRPSTKADGGGATGERKGVAAGPTVSGSAEPQRKAPRVVYPGPGSSAPAADVQE